MFHAEKNPSYLITPKQWKDNGNEFGAEGNMVKNRRLGAACQRRIGGTVGDTWGGMVVQYGGMLLW